MTHFDVVVLGAGPGGYVAAIRCAQLGLNTAIVEPKYWGGVCLNVGCIPSKALLRNAELAHIVTQEAATFGISGQATFDFGVAFDRSRTVADGRVAGIHYLMKKNKITEINGYGRFTDANTIVVDLNDGSQVTVVISKAGKTEELKADKVMQAIGFAPNVTGFGLEAAGVALTDRGAIAIDDYMRTNVPNIFAIGDVTAKLQLAHVAEAMGVVAAETIGGAETLALGDYRMMPRATFCQPQVASFGLTEEQAKAEGYDVKVAKFPFSANGKAHGLADPTGFVKVIADAKYGELLGAHLIGPDVSELLPELTLAQKWDLTVNELARNVHTHPTLSEALQECFHGLAGHMINF